MVIIPNYFEKETDSVTVDGTAGGEYTVPKIRSLKSEGKVCLLNSSSLFHQENFKMMDVIRMLMHTHRR